MSYVAPQDWKPSQGITIEGSALDIVKSTSSLSVLAGPGSGKTELLAQRAMYLLKTGACPPPKRILAVAFKVDAARNLQERVNERCDELEARRFESLTLHGFAKRLLDQFLEALPENLRPSPDYSILFPNRDIWDDFGNKHTAEIPEVRNYNNDRLSKIVHSTVPDLDGADTTIEESLRKLWWLDCLNRGRTSNLTFDMIMLLAIKILQTQPTVLAAVRQTYSYVFLDEFQDVTNLQYSLIKAAFWESGTIITAVGDSNQAIMRWAGALPDIFSKFNENFQSDSRKLSYNFRSNARIVELINSLAGGFEDDFVATVAARKNDPVPENAVEGWVFDTRDDEGIHIADYIKSMLEADLNLVPEDFVILARMRVNDVEKRLEGAFSNQGLKLRNEARNVGNVAIQDLTKEPIFRFLVSALKMANDVRDGNPFQQCRDIIANIQGLDISTDKGISASLTAVQTIVLNVQEISKAAFPKDVGGEIIANMLLSEERKTEFSRAYNDYRNRKYLDDVVRAFGTFFDECAKDAEDWETLISSMEGRGVVKLMTIHKSKGLEYHTVFFVEFNDESFWGNDDDVNVFFVALSRAREAIKFSFTRDSRGASNIKKMAEQLEAAAVEFKDMSPGNG